jgi:hypothetical protein
MNLRAAIRTRPGEERKWRLLEPRAENNQVLEEPAAIGLSRIARLF